MRPEIIEESTTLNVTIPDGYRLSVFAIGGGGGTRRGSFKQVLVDNKPSLKLTVAVGEEGQGGSSGGSTTIEGLPDYFSAPGGLSGGFS